MTLIDQAARDQALNPGQSFIVQAPAGSGKTGLLVRRVLALLCVVEKPEEILAITFTRKATAEMRERIIDALHKTQNQQAFDEHEKDLAAYCHKVLLRDEEKNWQLLRQPQRLKIQTIDSLCAELVRKMPWSTRFGSVPQIETDTDTLYQQAAQNLVQKIDAEPYQEALSTLLIHANGDLQGLKRQFAHMLTQRTSWLKLIFQDKALDSREALEMQWQSLIENLLDELEQTFGSALARELLELARYAQQNSPDNAEPHSDQILAALLDESPQAEPGNKIIQWRCIIEMICTANGFRKTVNKSHGFPRKDEAKTRMLEILGDLQDDTQADAVINRFRQCPEAKISEAEWHILHALKTSLPALAQELYVLMNERNCADYDELAQRAIDALGESEQPTDLALLQDYQLKHILMDEFQDTSPTQLELLKRLTAGWQIDDGRSLFFVGDPMQSIYGFRKADVRVFLQTRDRGINDIRPQALSLSVNFRSSPDIIDWVNQIMPTVFPGKDEPELAKVKYSESIAHHDFTGGVQTHLCVAEDNRSEADEILKLIQLIHAEQPKAEIAVLARKRAPLALLARRLRKANLAFESIELETLADQSIVQDLISLTAVYIQPMDTLSCLAILRAPWCGANLNDLTVLRASNKPVIEVLAKLEALSGLSLSGHQKLARLAAIVQPLNPASTALTLSERVYCAWLSLRAPACYEKHELVHAERFFSLLEALEAGRETLNRERLLAACTLHKTSSLVGNIKLMTFHKAKGLEFDQVILTGLASKSGGDNRHQTLIHQIKQDNNLLVAPNPMTGEAQPTKAGFIKQQQKAIEDEESARLLYVAVTRARKQLYLFGTLKPGRDGEIGQPQQGSLLRLLWPACQDAFKESALRAESSNPQVTDKIENTERPGISLSSLPTPLASLLLPDSIHFAPESVDQQSEQLEFDWAQEDTRIIGLAVHHLLQFTDAARLQSWQQDIDNPTIQASLVKSGLIDERIDAATVRIANILEKMAHDKRAHWLYKPDHTQIKSEWALSCQQNGKIAHYIIDRSFIDENGVRWIIDFKTGTHEGSDIAHFLDQEEKRYAPQLDQYARLVHALEPQREIRLGLYFAALGEWRERRF